MKTIRFIVASLLTLVCFASFAQADLIYASRVNCLNTQGYYNYTYDSGYYNYAFSNYYTSGQTWCTQSTGGDYFVKGGVAPVMLCDLGSIQTIDSLSLWGYGVKGNSASALTLEFYDSPAISGTPVYTQTFSSIAYTTDETKLNLTNKSGQATSVNARFVKITLTDNNGGDRVGVNDIKFNVTSTVTPTSATASVGSLSGYEPANLLDKNPDKTWCTSSASNSGYFQAGLPAPVLTYTLDSAKSLTGITVVPYPVSGNSLKTFTLTFKDANGNVIDVGDSSKYSFTMTDYTTSTSDYFSFPKVDGVKTVEMKITSNGKGFGSGGDRVGVADVYFNTIATKNATTPILKNQVLHPDNIVRPVSAKYCNNSSSSAADKSITTLFDGTGLNGGDAWYTKDTQNSNTKLNPRKIADYFYDGVSPSIEFTLPSESLYDSFSIWGYGGQGNQMTDFILELFNHDGDLVFADEFKLNGYINANEFYTYSLGGNYLFEKAKLTALDNGYYQLSTSWSDRLGFTEIAFYQDPNAIPEPSTWALLVLGFAGLMWYRRRK